MTYEFEYLLHLLSCGATNRKVQQPKHDIGWEKLFSLANQQAVMPLVAYAVKKAQLNIPEDIKCRVLNIMQNAAINVTIKKAAIIKLLDTFEKKGIQTSVLKGFAVAECYAVPECRISSDADVLISPQFEQMGYEILEENGFNIIKRHPEAHEAACDHPRMGHFELHIALFGKQASDSIFNSISILDILQEQRVLIQTVDGDYYTLGITDHMLFLIVHMVKHLISSGTNMRMLMDVVMYYKAYKNEIDKGRLWDIIDKIQCRELLNTIFSAMMLYGGFLNEDLDVRKQATDEQIRVLLDDLEECGGMNFSDNNRTESADVIRRVKMTENMGGVAFGVYMLKRFFKTSFANVFPNLNHLILKYPCIKKLPILIPYAWLHRLITKGIKAVREGKVTTHIVNEINISEAGKKRLEMFRKLEMM